MKGAALSTMADDASTEGERRVADRREATVCASGVAASREPRRAASHPSRERGGFLHVLGSVAVASQSSASLSFSSAPRFAQSP